MAKPKIRQKCRGPCAKTMRVRHFRPLFENPESKAKLHRICVECENQGWRWCAWGQHARRIDEFYAKPNGTPDTYACKECSAKRHATSGSPSHGTSIAERSEREKAQAEAEGRKPVMRIPTDYDIRRMLRIYRDTGNISHVAKQTGFHRNTVKKYLNKHKDTLEAGKRMMAPEPRPYSELSAQGKAMLESTVEGFLLFSSEILGLEFDPWAGMAALELLQAYLSPEDEWIVLNAPYNSGKSTVLTFAFAMWVTVRERTLGREPTIFLGHRAEARAKWYLGRIAREFEHNALLLEIFGRFRPQNKGRTVWSSMELLVEPLDWSILRQKEPSIAIGSYDGAIMSGHFKLVIWDDLVDEKNSLTSDQRDKLFNFWDGTAESRPTAGGSMVLSNCRFGPRDLSYTLKHQKHEDELDAHGRPKPMWRTLIYKAHYDELCKGEHGRDAKPWPEGCLLSPSRVTWNRLRRKMKDDRKYRLIYQQEDVDSAGALADDAWFEGGTDQKGMVVPGCFQRPLRFGQLRTDSPVVLSAVTTDPSGSKFWASVHWLVYQDGFQQVYRAERAPMMAGELIERSSTGEYSGLLEDWRAKAADENVPVRYWIVETRAQQQWLAQWEFITSWCSRNGIVLLPHDTNRVNKHDPDRGVEMTRSLWREGRVLIPYFGPEERYIGDVFKAEATAYPEGDTSDLLMNSWFLNHHLDTLVDLDTEDEDEEPQVPGWAKAKAPWWARNLGGEEEVPTTDPFGRKPREGVPV